MKWRLQFALFLFSFLASGSVWSQAVPCIYRLEMRDAAGDGWNGAELILSINGQVRNYTLAGGAINSIYLAFQNGDQLVASFFSGDADEDISFSLYNEMEGEVFSATGPVPFPSGSFTTMISCTSCPVPPISSIVVEDIRAFTANVNWLAPDPDGEYILEVGPAGFELGTGEIRSFEKSPVALSQLEENTAYEFYLTTVCANGDTSTVLGPYGFKTCWAHDVAVLEVLGLESSCDFMNNDTISGLLINYGGTPESLIPFAYSVNGEAIAIDMPKDGVYTGVLGKDSTDIGEFDRTYNFSEPGEYTVKVWTEMETDSVTSNDTAAVTFYSVPTIAALPYFEDFENGFSGWLVGAASERSTWEVGTPIGGTIKRAASGENAWVTNLNGPYNNNERSYLESPCMDFTNILSDPVISFQFWYSTENIQDQAWLEFSLDGGTTWSRVTDLDYSTEVNTWSGDDPINDWSLQSGRLTGTAGESDVRLRFAFQSDFATRLEGIAIDDIFIYVPSAVDLAATSLFTTGEPECATNNDLLQLGISNEGRRVVNTFVVNYQINGAPPQSIAINDLGLNPGEMDMISLTVPLDVPGVFDIVAWVELAEDNVNINDTARFQLVTAYPLPFAEDFESGIIPSRWQLPIGGLVTNGHGNESYVAAKNLFDQQTQFEVISPVIGLIEAADTLKFDYRYMNSGVNEDIPADLGPNDKLEVFVTLDCGANYELVATIDQSNHMPSAAFQELAIPLGAYAGETLQFRVHATWGAGDYWIDLDNFQIARCQGIVLSEKIIQRTDGIETATITPRNGIGPYTFQWSTGETTSTVELISGTYELTVTDRFGCEGFYSRLVSSTQQIEQLKAVELFPNPTSGQSILRLDFERPVNARVELLNAVGQVLEQRLLSSFSQGDVPIDLKNQPDGMFIIRVVVDNQWHVERLIHSRY